MNNWLKIKQVALSTIGKETEKEPDSKWKKSILLAEHSPIRLLRIFHKWTGIKYWISVHFCRHKIGIEHFVKTQRNDRVPVLFVREPKGFFGKLISKVKAFFGKPDNYIFIRDHATQDTPVNHIFEANAQAIINISRKRLCSCAHAETRAKWREFLETIKETEPELYSVCVPECVYRGFCPEMKKCGYFLTKEYGEKLTKYREC